MQTIQNQPEIQVKAILRRGNYTKCTPSLKLLPKKINAAAVGITGELEGFTCPDCGKNEGYFCMDGTVPVYFCGTQKCLQDDTAVTIQLKSNLKSTAYDPIERYGLGTIYKYASLTKWDAPEGHKTLVCNWLERPKNFLILVGGPGTGKTFFCASILNFFGDTKREVFYTNTRRFFEHLQRNISDDKNQYEAVRYFSKREILIFDDLGAAANSDWKQEMLLDLFDYRYENELPTVITTNVYPEHFKATFGERTESRLKHKKNTVLGTGHDDKRKS